ncbi:uncharacterized protein LOC128327117 isoform X2 [Hemicordylus capensis]|nr:uncharacterized protein LOC128327117 isoform X2 [Hemicordylus capensis]
MGKAKMVTTFEQEVPDKEFMRPIIPSESTRLIIEFDEAELLAKLAKEIVPRYGMMMQLAVKNQTWTIVSLKVHPSDSTWNADLYLKKDPQEVNYPDEQRYVFNCKQLSKDCSLTIHEAHKEPIVQNLQLGDVIRALLQAFHNPSPVLTKEEATEAHEDNVKTEEAEIYQSSEE